jgi:hypothetical protein
MPRHTVAVQTWRCARLRGSKSQHTDSLTWLLSSRKTNSGRFALLRSGDHRALASGRQSTRPGRDPRHKHGDGSVSSGRGAGAHGARMPPRPDRDGPGGWPAGRGEQRGRLGAQPQVAHFKPREYTRVPRLGPSTATRGERIGRRLEGSDFDSRPRPASSGTQGPQRYRLSVQPRSRERHGAQGPERPGASHLQLASAEAVLARAHPGAASPAQLTDAVASLQCSGASGPASQRTAVDARIVRVLERSAERVRASAEASGFAVKYLDACATATSRNPSASTAVRRSEAFTSSGRALLQRAASTQATYRRADDVVAFARAQQWLQLASPPFWRSVHATMTQELTGPRAVAVLDVYAELVRTSIEPMHEPLCAALARHVAESAAKLAPRDARAAAIALAELPRPPPPRSLRIALARAQLPTPAAARRMRAGEAAGVLAAAVPLGAASEAPVLDDLWSVVADNAHRLKANELDDALAAAAALRAALPDAAVRALLDAAARGARVLTPHDTAQVLRAHDTAQVLRALAAIRELPGPALASALCTRVQLAAPDMAPAAVALALSSLAHLQVALPAPLVDTLRAAATRALPELDGAGVANVLTAAAWYRISQGSAVAPVERAFEALAALQPGARDVNPYEVCVLHACSSA